jgi:broad specificity phosphatase PhoE
MCTPRFPSPILLLTALLAGCAASRPPLRDADLTTIYVVRHAEKLNSDADTPLSEAGEQRAVDLATRLADAGVERIYATTLQRTQGTVARVAAAAGVEVKVLEPAAVDGLVALIQADDRGRVVLVAGHSNTVPAIVQALSGQAVEDIPEHVFDRLYRVDLPAKGAASVTLLQYGVPTP